MKQKFITNRNGTWRKILYSLCFMSIGTLAAVSQTRVSGTVFDAAGRFALAVKPNTTLTVSYIGFLTQDVPVGSQSELRITLVEDTKTKARE